MLPKHKETPQEALPLRAFLPVVFASFVFFFVQQALSSGVSIYLASESGLTAYAGIAAAVFALSAGISHLLWGPAVDLRGRLRIALFGSALLAGGLFACLIDPQNVALIIGSRLLQGVGFAACSTALATMAADVLPEQRLGEGIGYYNLGSALSLTVAPGAGIALASTDPASNLFLCSGCICLFGALMLLLCRYERRLDALPASSRYRKAHEPEQGADENEMDACASNDSQTSEKPAIPRGKELFDSVFDIHALPAAIPMFFYAIACAFPTYFVGLYGARLAISNPGMYFTLAAVAMIGVRFLSKTYMDVLAPLNSYVIALLCLMGSFGALAMAPQSELWFYLAGLLNGLGVGVGQPLLMSLAVKTTSPSHWGAANALTLLSSDAGMGFGSLLWGFIDDASGFATAISVAPVFLIISGVAAWISLSRIGADSHA